MAEVEFENFEITEKDLENEFNPNRGRRRLTKKQQIYGVFADDGSDDERPSFSRSRDFTTPISFVGGGVQQTGKKPEELKDDETESDSSVEEIPAIKPTKKSEFNYKGQQRFSGLHSNEPEFGKWEKYTKGIGMKLLLQQGYKPGGGLGKDLQGISKPVEARQRKGRGAVGAYGSENAKQNLRPNDVVIDSEGEDSQEARNRTGQWKKPEEGKKKKIKYAYKTIDDVMAEGSQRKLATEISRLSKVKVIDMTGPEQRVLSGYHAIHSQHSKPQESEADKGTKTSQHFALPELMHNLNLLVDMTEQQILRSGRELSYEKDQIINMEHETENLTEMIAAEKNQIYALESLVEMIDKLENSDRNELERELTLTDAATIIREIQNRFYNEYQMYGLSDLAVGVAVPMFVKLFGSWKPLEDNSSFGITEVKEWRDLLESNSVSKAYAQDKIESYDQIIWEAWLPPLRTAVLNWNCRDCNLLIDLIINWMPLLPKWILNNLLELVVLPRLQQEVDNWNPLTDHVPIDAWIHPWLTLMTSNQLEILYPTIRQKLANGLTNWHPSDCSAKRILEPWKGVFPPGTLEAFLIKNVLPKLAIILQQFVINPVQQHLEPWQWVMTWEDMIPVSSMVALLEKYFFPKWMQVLCSWLGQNPNYEEISNWYAGWKKMIPPNIFAHPTIKDYFSRALDVMNNAVSVPQGIGFPPMGAQEHMAYWESLNRRKQMENAMSNRIYEAPSQSSNASMTFKDLIERRALENALVFMPIPNRYYEAKQIYRFGNQVICIDRSVIILQREHTWVPTSLQSLVDIAK